MPSGCLPSDGRQTVPALGIYICSYSQNPIKKGNGAQCGFDVHTALLEERRDLRTSWQKNRTQSREAAKEKNLSWRLGDFA